MKFKSINKFKKVIALSLSALTVLAYTPQTHAELFTVSPDVEYLLKGGFTSNRQNFNDIGSNITYNITSNGRTITITGYNVPTVNVPSLSSDKYIGKKIGILPISYASNYITSNLRASYYEVIPEVMPVTITGNYIYGGNTQLINRSDNGIKHNCGQGVLISVTLTHQTNISTGNIYVNGVNYVFPGLPFNRSLVICTYCGVIDNSINKQSGTEDNDYITYHMKNVKYTGFSYREADSEHIDPSLLFLKSMYKSGIKATIDSSQLDTLENKINHNTNVVRDNINGNLSNINNHVSNTTDSIKNQINVNTNSVGSNINAHTTNTGTTITNAISNITSNMISTEYNLRRGSQMPVKGTVISTNYGGDTSATLVRTNDNKLVLIKYYDAPTSIGDLVIN